MNSIRKLWNRFGYYVVLSALVAILAVTAYIIRNHKGDEAKNLTHVPPKQVVSSVDESLKDRTDSNILSWPVPTREIVLVNSPDTPIWSEGLQMFHTHDGIDIAAALGEAVYASMDGEVVAIYLDEMLGNTIKIKHKDDINTIYANLSTLNLVKIGQTVKRGEIIGAVGNSSPFEGDRPTHLHFEAYKNGEWLDLPNIRE